MVNLVWESDKIDGLIVRLLEDASVKRMVSRLKGVVQQGRELLRRHGDAENQVEIEIVPVDHPLKTAALGVFGIVGLIGVPIAMLLPVVPATPFAMLGLVCLARISPRFRRWLLRQRFCKTALSMIYTRSEPVFVLLRKLLQILLGHPWVRMPAASPSYRT